MNNNYLNLLNRLVNIDSGTGDRDGFNRILTELTPWFEKLQLKLRIFEDRNGLSHLYAVRGRGNRVLLVAHLDTVFPKGTAAKRQFSIDGAIARGPGVSDCKSGIVTILGALDILTQAQWPDCEIGCFFNSDEEIGSPGSRPLLEELAKDAKAVLVAEPAEGENITIARKGIGRFVLRVIGKAAHSGSNYSDGRNAILEIANKIIAIQQLTDLAAGITLNVGVVNGGVRPNIVPDYAEAEIDLRIQLPGQEAEIIAALKEIATQATVPETKGSLTGEITRPPLPLSEQNLQLYRNLNQIATQLGTPLGTFQSGGGSDANFTSALGIPTIDGVGPIGGGHHSEDEYLLIDSLEQRIKLLAEFLKQFPG